MRRVFLALVILAASASLFCAFRNSAAQFRNQSRARYQVWLMQTQRLAQAQMQSTELTVGIRELKQTLANKPYWTAKPGLATFLIGTNSPIHLSAEAREQLLAELGFDWKSTGDHVVVSKDSLRNVNLEAIHDNRLTDTLCSVLAVTREERTEIERVMESLAAEFKAWAMSRVQRAEPEGNVLAKYTMPSEPQFSQSLSNSFSAGLAAALGAERTELMLGYARPWMDDLGIETFGVATAPTTMTVKRYAAGDESRLGFELHRAGSIMSADVSPHQPFPEAFRPIFPGGWPDLAKQEGFELPKEFQKQR